MGKKDLIGKDILKCLAFDLATILLKLDIDPDTVELLDTEKQRIESRRADLVVRVRERGHGERYLLHIEIQNDNDRTMPLRMLRYYTDIALQWPGEPIRQYVIYIGKAHLTMAGHLHEQGLEYDYRILNMREVDCQTLITQDTPEALVLAILCDFKGKPAGDVVTYILQRLRTLAGEDEQVFRRHVEMLEILSENRDLQTTIKEAEQMLTQIDRRKLPSYQLGLEQGMEQGMERGLEQGLEQGLERGLEKGLEQGLTRGALESRLETAGNLLEVLSDRQIARAVGLPVHQIEQLRKQKRGNGSHADS